MGLFGNSQFLPEFTQSDPKIVMNIKTIVLGSDHVNSGKNTEIKKH